jgi:hypothetical protein
VGNSEEQPSVVETSKAASTGPLCFGWCVRASPHVAHAGRCQAAVSCRLAHPCARRLSSAQERHRARGDRPDLLRARHRPAVSVGKSCASAAARGGTGRRPTSARSTPGRQRHSRSLRAASGSKHKALSGRRLRISPLCGSFRRHGLRGQRKAAAPRGTHDAVAELRGRRGVDRAL